MQKQVTKLVQKVRELARAFRSVIRKKPILLVPICAVLTLLLFALVECGRAWVYLNSAETYRNSVSMQSLQTKVDKLNRAVEIIPSAYYCDISTVNLIANFNEAYSTLGPGDNAPEAVVATITDDLELLTPPPAYSSYVDFLPRPKQARVQSEQMSQAAAKLQELTKEDVRSTYCLALQQALSRVYFMQDLQSPEGVAALLPGQIENFQTNVSQAVDLLTATVYPSQFEAEHIASIKNLQMVSTHLRADDNNYTQFARQIELDLKELLQVFVGLKNESVDLQDRVTKIALQTQLLADN